VRIERLFNVLVMGGAALGPGCSGTPDKSSSGSSESSGGAGATAGTRAVTGGSSNLGGSGDVGGQTGQGAAGAVATGGSTADSADAGPVLECHIIDTMGHGTSSDPCGCPCCWAANCPNTGDCCGGFCVGGDQGRGCCGR